METKTTPVGPYSTKPLELIPGNEWVTLNGDPVIRGREDQPCDSFYTGQAMRIRNELNSAYANGRASLAAGNALLAEQGERLREALKPFADFGAAWIRMPAGTMPDDSAVYAIHGSTKYAAEITLGQLKEAHRILTSLTPASK